MFRSILKALVITSIMTLTASAGQYAVPVDTNSTTQEAMPQTVNSVAQNSALLDINTIAQAQLTLEQEKQKVALDTIQTEALRALIAASIITSELGEISEVSENVKRRYNYVAKGSAWTLLIMAGGWVLIESADESRLIFESVLTPVTDVVRRVGKLVTYSTESAEMASEKIGADRFLRASGHSVEAVWDAFAYVLRPLSTGGITGSLLTVSVLYGIPSSKLAVVAGPSYLYSHGPQEVLADAQMFRKILGYDNELSQNIEMVTGRVSHIFDLPYDRQQSFREDLKDRIVAEGVRTDFNPDKMEVDVFDLLLDKLDPKQRRAAIALRELYENLPQSQKEYDSVVADGDLAQAIGVTLAISAVLEEILASPQITASQEREVATMLQRVQRALQEGVKLYASAAQQ